MGKPLYACTSCSETFTRNTSASNTGYIVTWAEYVTGKSTNRYRATSTHSPRRRFQQNATTPATTVTDSMGDTFRPVGVQIQPQHQQQQYQPYPQQYQAPRTITAQNDFASISRRLALTDQMFQPQPIPQPELDPTKTKNEWGLSSATILKLAELRGLLYQHSDTFPDFDVILQGAKHFAMQGDNAFLDEKLAFFRNFEA